ncbi:MAG: hypothetical protein WDN45_04645 [Caulobacteraceae bacterium]
MQIGDEEIANAPLEIGQTSDDFYDVLIGGDFLTAHHLYVANSQQKIYFTYAGLPNVPVFKAHEPGQGRRGHAHQQRRRHQGALGRGGPSPVRPEVDVEAGTGQSHVRAGLKTRQPRGGLDESSFRDRRLVRGRDPACGPPPPRRPAR